MLQAHRYLALVIAAAFAGLSCATNVETSGSTTTGSGAATSSSSSSSTSSSVGGGGLGPPSQPRSCVAGTPGAGTNCGLAGDSDCCASTLVPGGDFLRLYDGVNADNDNYPATVTPFYLDVFDITVGRFRAFVDAYPGSKPAPGDGAFRKISGSGWQAGWPLPSTKAELVAGLHESTSTCDESRTWTDDPGANETRPMNCMTWYELFAFCAWDRARLPIEVEWLFVFSGGAEQRVYPWSQPPTSTYYDATFLVYSPDMTMPSFTMPEPVGTKPKGAARWGQLDMAGNLAQILIDKGNDLELPCVDCAILGGSQDPARLVKGASFEAEAGENQVDFGDGIGLTQRLGWTGGRCARDPAP